MKTELDLNSRRARKARFAQRVGHHGYQLFVGLAICLGVAGLALFFAAHQTRIGYLSAAAALIFLMLALWYRYDLADIRPLGRADRLDDMLASSLLAKLRQPLTPRSVWESVTEELPAEFLLSHLLVDSTTIADGLSQEARDMEAVWQRALDLYGQGAADELHAGIVAAALITTSSPLEGYLAHIKLGNDDVIEVLGWLQRLLDYIHRPKPYFGGFGRDWASGFTPTLDGFGENISRSIEAGAGWAHFLSHADVLDGVVHNLERGTGVAIVGETGAGKTELVHGLAERLLEGRDPDLRYYQIVSLNASLILSANTSSLERLILTFFGEAVHAGNIILFLDEAELFFGGGAGAFDLSQILLPIIERHSLKVIAAFTPGEWQQLRTGNDALAAGFAPITLTEPPEADTMKILEDNALLLEQRDDLLVSYDAVREAYRLSGQYMQDQAYPGKALKLLEQATPYAAGKVLTAEGVQAAIEKTLGVRVSAASAPEADTLLHLEDRIHERMINQTRAVNVIAAALRRGRAGVANPKRPVGSFLFMGPTGVGKTELARSLAAVYFGDERQMIRLDMSEYQQPDDARRLLAAGQADEKSLLLSIREQPFAVVLLDEVEKAHPNVLNLLLQLLDEGQLTDAKGRPASFRNTIIIATSNAGAADIARRVEAGETLDDFERPLIDKLIAGGQFKPELINRFDEVVLFRPLQPAELAQVAALMLGGVNETLAKQKIRVDLTPAALEQIVKEGYDPEFGARPMRRIIQKRVEDAIAVKILDGEATPGQTITLDVADLAQSAKTTGPEAASSSGTNAIKK